MKHIAKAALFVPIVLSMLSVNIERISLAIQTGNSKELARYFDNNVEITVADNEEMYSRTQAEQVVRDFFIKHPPATFKVIHKGSSNEGSEYCIGTLVTSNQTYRTYIYIKQKGPDYYIQELRFEED